MAASGDRAPRWTTCPNPRTAGRSCRYLRPCDRPWPVHVPEAPSGLPLRHEHGGLPDRGSGHRGRQGTEHLGHVRRGAGPDLGRQQRRRWRATTTTGSRRTSTLMQRLGTGGYRLSISWPRIQPDRTRPGQRGRPGLLRPAHRLPPRARRPADGDALPLGPAAGARGRRRMAEPRHRRLLRRVRPHRGRAVRRPRRALDPDQRAQRGLDPRLRHRSARAGQGPALRLPCRPLTTCSWPTAARRSSCAGRARPSIGCANNHAPDLARQRRRRRRRCQQDLRRPVERHVPRADAARAATRPTWRRCSRTSCTTATSRRSASRSTSTA